MDFGDIGTPVDDLQSFHVPKPERLTPSPWYACKTAGELAEAIHKAALEKYPASDYAKAWRVN